MRIDWWTLALQAINVLILVWILGRFLYRPLAEIIEQRRAAVAKGLADASAMRDAIAAEKAEIATTRAGFVQERDKLLAEGRRQIEAERNTMLQDASERIEKARRESETMLSRDRAALEQGLADKASGLAVEIARKLLAKLPPDAALGVFLDGLSEQIRELPPKNRELVAASAQRSALAVTTAVALSEVQKRKCEEAIAAAVGSETNITFRTDARLMAGLELQADALILKNSWQADLSQILAQLNKR